MEELAGEGAIFLNEGVVGDVRWSRRAKVKTEDQDGDCKTSWRIVGCRGHCTAIRKGNRFMRGDEIVPAWRANVFSLRTTERLMTTCTGKNKEGMW